MEDAMTKQTPTSQTASEDAIDNPGGRFAGDGDAQNGKSREAMKGAAAPQTPGASAKGGAR
jgi:hypothetical protein